MEARMKSRIFTIILALALLAAAPALALDLHAARDAGIIGEKADGYVAVLKKSADADALARDVNAKRKAEYARISQENKQPVGIVAKLAAQQIIEGLNAGDSYQDADGSWKTR
jgi:uncharacterized protein YdbL (DUF1318 family)